MALFQGMVYSSHTIMWQVRKDDDCWVLKPFTPQQIMIYESSCPWVDSSIFLIKLPEILLIQWSVKRSNLFACDIVTHRSERKNWRS